MILFGRLTTIGLIPFVEGSGMFDSLDTQGIEVWSPPGRERKDLSSVSFSILGSPPFTHLTTHAEE